MSRPVLVKLGGSVLTDKAKPRAFRRTVARRLCLELARAGVPVVLVHGAGSFGHIPAAEAGIGSRTMSPRDAPAVAATLTGVALLHAQILDLAEAAGLCPVGVPVHISAHSDGDDLLGVPVARIQRLLEDGYTPVLPGTIVRDEDLGWRVVSGDELMAILAEELDPRLALFVTDVEGVYDRHPSEPGASLLASIDRAAHSSADGAGRQGGHGADVTGRIHGKLNHAFNMAQATPVLIANGTVRGRIQDVLRGKDVPCTRVVP